MTVDEFSTEFDTLVDSYRRIKSFDSLQLLDSIEFNEYEKSVYLTLALLEIVKDLYASKYTADSFESSEDIRRYLDSLVTLEIPTAISTAPKLVDKYTHTTYKLDDKCWYIVYELAKYNSSSSCISGKVADVVPVTHDAYIKVVNNPFRGVNDRRVLRLDVGKVTVELVSAYPISQYIVRYVRKPKPIILAPLKTESIDGETTVQTSELTESLHRTILVRAVSLGLSSKGIKTNSEKDKDTDKDE